jgi:hypothetical protein
MLADTTAELTKALGLDLDLTAVLGGIRYRTDSLHFFMYRRSILCTLYGAVDFLNALKKGC